LIRIWEYRKEKDGETGTILELRLPAQSLAIGWGAALHYGPRKVAAMSDDRALHILRRVLTRLRSQPWERDRWSTLRVQSAREEALAQYGSIRSPELVGSIEKDLFLKFLRSENDRHRMGFGRVGMMAANMPRLREALTLLVDERLSLRTRLDRVRPPRGQPMIQGLGPGIITLILHFVDPSRYAILNRTSDRIIRRLGLYPDIPITSSLATRYLALNEVMLGIASALEVDLGLLDTLWWRVLPQDLDRLGLAQAGVRA
jgi:hypothetical protein